MLLKKNVKLSSPMKNISPWRKASIGIWKNACEAAIYSRLEVDATNILSKITEYKQYSRTILTNALIAQALTKAIEAYPPVNSIIRFGKFYPRKEINMYFQVALGRKTDDLSGVCIKQIDQLTIEQMSTILKEKSSEIRLREDPDYLKRKITGKMLPGFLSRLFIRVVNFVSYTLNLKCFFNDTDKFGSAMITDLSMFNVDNAFVPLVPLSHCPIIVAVGKINKKAVVEEDEIIIKPILELCFTLDHRLIDGVGAGKLLRVFKKKIQG